MIHISVSCICSGRVTLAFKLPFNRYPRVSVRPQNQRCVCSGPYGGFEGLRAEECGILNGCENGRCVRVREGYTCDCFDGYELDLNKMACIGRFSSNTGSLPTNRPTPRPPLCAPDPPPRVCVYKCVSVCSRGACSRSR